MNFSAEFFNELIDVTDKSNGGNQYFSDELSELFKKHDFYSFNGHDAEQLDYFYKVKPNGKEIEVLTDELDVQSIIKIFINWGAKIELYSRHDY